jgi:hypothetical protein
VSRVRPGSVALLLGISVLLSGCGQGAVVGNAGQDPFGCGIVVTPATAVVGEDIVVSRPPTEPGDICTTLAPGTTQTLEVRSAHVSDPARGTTTVTVTADGSFDVSMPVPADLRLDTAVVTAIPPAESDCTAAAAAQGTPDDCYYPRAQFTAAIDPADFSPVRIVATDVAMPALPATADVQDSYAVAGPGRSELTLVVFGSGCASRPAAYRHDAPAGRLDIVTEVIVPAGQNGCTEPRIPWTTVIELPDGRLDYTSVTVDNLDTVLLD